MSFPEERAGGGAPARYVMIGGFLGAGKTTAVAQLATALHQRGLRVGLITNDQGSGLVDTSVLRARGFPTEEIAGGCFCCRFNSLTEAAARLTSSSRPDVFIAEPVGSCTDLVATVTYPLRRIYGDRFTIAPLSVVLDPQRAMRIFGLAEGRAFSDKVLYIYRKQLEEADVIVVNKRDLVSEYDLVRLQSTLRIAFPHAEVRTVSARHGDGLDDWFERILNSQPPARRTMEVDYRTYADGEARLAWLNATLQLGATTAFDANAVLEYLAGSIQQRLLGNEAEVAHLKMTFSPDGGLNDLAALNLVRNDVVPELSLRLEQPCTSGQLIINLRAETSPETLKRAIETSMSALPAQFAGIGVRLDHLEHFRPGQPQPTHRILAPA